MKNISLPVNFAWSTPVAEVAHNLKTDFARGLTEEEVKHRLAKFGKNEFGRMDGPSALVIFARQFRSPLILALGLAVVVTIFLHEWLNAIVIFLAIAINAGLGFYQEHKASRVIANLRSYIQERAWVVRAGEKREIDASLLVPGDLVHLTSGMRVPADARLIGLQNFSVDESILTGESLPVNKQTEPLSEATFLAERTNMLFGGTLAVEGSARAIITATASQTEIGKLADLVTETKTERTPLQKAVANLAWLITIGLGILVTGIFVFGVMRGEPILAMLLVSIAVIVGAVPEALPIGLTSVLAVGVERIAKRKGIMRSLAAAETLGSTTLVMTDKTGTLTEAKMRLTDVVLASTLADDRSDDYKPQARFSLEQKELLRLALYGTDVVAENPADEPSQWRLSGHTLETNIVRSAAEHGFNLFDKNNKDHTQNILPFSSDHKFSVSEVNLATKMVLAGTKSDEFLVVIGAPDVLLKRSRLGKDAYLQLLERIEEMSARGRRLLGVAVTPLVSALARLNPENINHLVFMGLLAFHDPIRAEVPAALQRIENYGVRVVMATGDLKGTALAVAREIGWEINEGEVLTGEELRQLTDQELSEVLARVRIFARVTPKDKLRIAQLYKKRGEVVAMTGDGVNDAPSLKAADIGIAVGSGSDVAKGVADLVLLDDNFNTIVATIEEGKRMLRNIKKIFIYLISGSLDEVFLIGGSIFLGLSLPLSAMQIIWVNLLTDSLPAIAFAFDKEKNVSHEARKPSGILDAEVKFLALGIGVLSSILLLLLYWWLVRYVGVELNLARSVLFACFASYTLLISFSLHRLNRPLFTYSIIDNKLLIGGVLFGLIFLLATFYLPVFQKIFGVTLIGPLWTSFVIAWVGFNIILIEGAKWLFYRRA